MTVRNPVPCPECDGLGEWDEGPINTGGPAPVDPIYRQVKCPECGGGGQVEHPFAAALSEFIDVFCDGIGADTDTLCNAMEEKIAELRAMDRKLEGDDIAF